MSSRLTPLTLGASTFIPYALLGGFGPGESVWPWLAMFAGRSVGADRARGYSPWLVACCT
jgi:hypothetical protein